VTRAKATRRDHRTRHPAHRRRLGTTEERKTLMQLGWSGLAGSQWGSLPQRSEEATPGVASGAERERKKQRPLPQ